MLDLSILVIIASVFVSAPPWCEADTKALQDVRKPQLDDGRSLQDTTSLDYFKSLEEDPSSLEEDPSSLEEDPSSLEISSRALEDKRMTLDTRDVKDTSTLLDAVPTWILIHPNRTGSISPASDRALLSTFWNWLWGGSNTGTGTTPGITGVSGEVDVLPESEEDLDAKPLICDCKCGLASRVRIVGGEETRVNQYPWMAMLMYDGRFYCGATLINPLYVLTAAHCVDGFTATRIKVRLLEHDRNSVTESISLMRSVRGATIHKRYNQGTFNNDIALLRLDKDVPIDGAIRPVCLPTIGQRFTGEIGTVTGWGKVSENRPVSTVLREVQVPVLSNTKCKTFYGSSQITENMVCAGYEDGGRDSCQGDSGGPLHVVNGTQHQIIGVVSWGEGCARPNNPGVYTRVNRYLSWIARNTAGSCFCAH